MTPEAERRAFLEALTTSCAAPSPLRVVMTARTDMWDRVAAETGQVRDVGRADRAARPAALAHRPRRGDQRAGPPLAPDPRGRPRRAAGRRHRLRRRAAAAGLHAGPDGRRRRGRPAHPRGVRRDRRRQGRHRLPRRRGRARRPHRGRGRRGDPAPGQPHRRDPAQAAGPGGRRAAAAPGDPRRPGRRPAGGDQRGQRPAGLRPGARVAVLGLAAAGRADRAPPRRPGAPRAARAPGRRLARGRRAPSPGCCPASSSTRPATGGARNARAGDRRRRGVRRRLGGPPAPRPDGPGRGRRGRRRAGRQPGRGPAGQRPRRPAPRRAGAGRRAGRDRPARAGARPGGRRRRPAARPRARPGRRASCRSCRAPCSRAPARDVLRAPGQATFFSLAVGGPRGRGQHDRRRRPWSGTPSDEHGAHVPAGRSPSRSGPTAGLRRGRRRRTGSTSTTSRPRASRPRWRSSAPTTSPCPSSRSPPTAPCWPRARRSLGDAVGPARPVGAAAAGDLAQPPAASPTALAVLDDGRVLAVRRAPTSSRSGTPWATELDRDARRPAAPTPPSSTSTPPPTGTPVLIDYPHASTPSPVVDLASGTTVGSYQRHRPEPAPTASCRRSPGPPAWIADGRHGGRLRPRRPRLRLRHRRRPPGHRAHRRPHLAGLRGRLHHGRACWSPPASTGRCGSGTRARPTTEVSGST